MMRTVLVMASLLLMGGGWLLKNADTPFVGVPIVSEVLPTVDQGIPLTQIVLPASALITTAAEAEAVTGWWRRQPEELLAAAQCLLPTDTTIADGSALYAYACSDGTQVVLFTDHQGLVGRCGFDSMGALRFCEVRPTHTLPIVEPQQGGTPRRISGEEAQQLAVRLLRLRDSSPMFWFEAEVAPLAESAEARWESDCDGWVRTVETASASPGGRSGITSTVKLDANGAVREARTWHWRSYGPCMVRPRKPKAPALLVRPDEPEPPLPIANN